MTDQSPVIKPSISMNSTWRIIFPLYFYQRSPIMSFTIGFLSGFVIGWIVLARPAWADSAWQWIRHKTT